MSTERPVNYGYDDERMRRVWYQTSVPVILNRGKARPRLKLPWRPPPWRHRTFIIGAHRPARRRDPEWHADKRYWEIPHAWYSDLVARCVEAWGSCWIIQPYQAHETCAPACWNGVGEDCQCSCMGTNHGSGQPGGGWTIVGEAFAVRWGERTLACRLVGPKGLVCEMPGLQGVEA